MLIFIFYGNGVLLNLLLERFFGGGVISYFVPQENSLDTHTAQNSAAPKRPNIVRGVSNIIPKNRHINVRSPPF